MTTRMRVTVEFDTTELDDRWLHHNTCNTIFNALDETTTVSDIVVVNIQKSIRTWEDVKP